MSWHESSALPRLCGQVHRGRLPGGQQVTWPHAPAPVLSVVLHSGEEKPEQPSALHRSRAG